MSIQGSVTACVTIAIKLTLRRHFVCGFFFFNSKLKEKFEKIKIKNKKENIHSPSQIHFTGSLKLSPPPQFNFFSYQNPIVQAQIKYQTQTKLQA